MTSHEAVLIKRGWILDLKIYDDVLVHHFIINGRVSYEISKLRGDLVARADAEVQDLQQDDRIYHVVIRTSSHIFEVVPGPNYTYRAHAKLRVMSRDNI